MAKVKTLSINHMTTGNVTDDTRLVFAIFDDAVVAEKLARWTAFAAANAQWRIDNPNQPDPGFCAVATPGSPTLAEKVFVEVRFFAVNNLDSTKEFVSSDWHQVDTTTGYPTLSAGFLADLKKIYDAERTALGYDPV